MEPLPCWCNNVFPGSPGGSYSVPGKGGGVDGVVQASKTCGSGPSAADLRIDADAHCTVTCIYGQTPLRPSLYCEWRICGERVMLNKHGGINFCYIYRKKIDVLWQKMHFIFMIHTPRLAV